MTKMKKDGKHSAEKVTLQVPAWLMSMVRTQAESLDMVEGDLMLAGLLLAAGAVQTRNVQLMREQATQKVLELMQRISRDELTAKQRAAAVAELSEWRDKKVAALLALTVKEGARLRSEAALFD